MSKPDISKLFSIVFINDNNLESLDSKQGKVTSLYFDINRLLHMLRSGWKSDAMWNASHNGDNNTLPSTWRSTRQLIPR